VNPHPADKGLARRTSPRYSSQVHKQTDSAGERRHAGLCADCQYSRQIESERGSLFYRCERSRRDSSFAKYPKLPMLQCPGYVPKANNQTAKEAM
jgi:hypothetical protein